MRLLHTVYPSSHPDEPLSAITRQPYRQPQQRGGDFRARVTVAKDGKRETVDHPLMAVENALPNWAFEKESTTHFSYGRGKLSDASLCSCIRPVVRSQSTTGKAVIVKAASKAMINAGSWTLRK